MDRERSPEEARQAGGAWLLEVPLSALEASPEDDLSVELHDDAGNRFTLRPE
jgi:hypothetical protein